MALSQRADPILAPLVLIVDRDPDTRSMYAEYLARAGWATEQAEDGREALAKAISLRPAAIVTETRLAFIDGYELCRFLRRDDDTAGVSIIVVTGDGYPASVTRARQAGAEAVLIKPCLPEQLEHEIRRVTRVPGPSAQCQSGSAAERDATPQLLQSRPAEERRSLVRAHQRHATTTPALTPPALLCPSCDRPLSYDRSHIGGVSERHPEQWDYFVCGACGSFQYRHRTRKLRRV